MMLLCAKAISMFAVYRIVWPDLNYAALLAI